jgi:hypothetical protein
MRRISTFLFLIAIAFSCVDPIDLKVDSDADAIVIDGLVTNEPGPHIIKVGRSIPFDNSKVLGAYFKAEAGAIVIIRDSDGNQVQLTEGKGGNYQTPAGFIGQPGKSYWVEVQTKDGSVYQSSQELLNPVPEIDTILYEYIVYKRLAKNAVGDQVETNATGFMINVRVNDPPGKNYYRWESTGIFEFFSLTDRPDIKQCWAPYGRVESTVIVADDLRSQGRTIDYEVGIIPYDRPTYFLVDIKQYSLSERAYEFWKRVQDQQTNTGTIFDPAPAPIDGNIVCTTDPTKKAYGFFTASAVFGTNNLINRFQASGLVSPTPYIEPIPGDCRDDYPGATTVKPKGFK